MRIKMDIENKRKLMDLYLNNNIDNISSWLIDNFDYIDFKTYYLFKNIFDEKGIVVLADKTKEETQKHLEGMLLRESYSYDYKHFLNNNLQNVDYKTFSKLIKLIYKK